MKPYLSKAFFLCFGIMLSSHAFASEKGAQLFEEKCAVCHLKQRPAYDQVNTMVAPPMQGVMFHVTEAKPAKEEATRFIVDYIFDPQRSKALCMTHSIERFGLMPSQKGLLTTEEAHIIAEYLYNTYK